jgi:hypothetical protein
MPLRLRGSGCIDPNFLDLGTRWGEWSAARPCRFTAGTHWVGGYVGSGRGGDDKILDSDPSVVQPVASRYTDYAIPAIINIIISITQIRDIIEK